MSLLSVEARDQAELIHALEKKLEDASADTARLDWLESQMPMTIMKYRESECIGDVVMVGETNATGKTLRAAIDAGRKR